MSTSKKYPYILEFSNAKRRIACKNWDAVVQECVYFGVKNLLSIAEYN